MPVAEAVAATGRMCSPHRTDCCCWGCRDVARVARRTTAEAATRRPRATAHGSRRRAGDGIGSGSSVLCMG